LDRVYSSYLVEFALREERESKMKNTAVNLKRSTLTLVVIAVLVTLLPTCGSNEALITVPAGAQAGDLVDLASCTFTSIDGELAAECGTLVVPENRSDPYTRLIALPVTRLKAESDTPVEPIFWLSGGPGQENVMRYPLDGVTENHDFVMVGYRGVDGQVPLECPEVSQAISRAPGTVLSPESIAAYAAGTAQCAERLESEGIDLAGYTITETIDDVEAARKAFGYDEINLYGNSYGTRVQQVYMWRYPESLKRVIMVSVNPPGHLIWDPDAVDAQIADYAALCARDTACSARTDDLVATMREVKENIPDSWMGIAIDRDGVQLMTKIMFNESIQPPDTPVPFSGPAAVDLWLDAAEGNYSGMAMISLTKNMFLPNLFNWGHFLSMGGSVEDYRDASLDYQTFLNPPDTLIGAPMSRFVYGFTEGWPAYTIDEEYFMVQPSDVETLLVSGNIDFSTPPQFATEELLPYLTNGEQVFLEDFGHTESVWFSQPEARAHLVNTFFDTGEVDASLYEYQPVDFTVERDWSDLMRTFIIIISIVIAAIIALLWFTIYRIRRRKARNN
jgi:pimeloyl-ACP methyl ester carboxylesterase